MSSAWYSADFRYLPVAARTIPTESSCLTSFCAETVDTPRLSARNRAEMTGYSTTRSTARWMEESDRNPDTDCFQRSWMSMAVSRNRSAADTAAPT